ncbi:L-aspartate oxidase [Microbacterium sp. MPKO10]|uniref:L-aspartate oxidase n=1 Tax=Microbacterium sp. MPKO10 TaxID=2989818 RepID=UPI002235D880|nr:L-aspartate oxidase [Microbacterium sp. MPKO10]MCW4458058.1 L-aspartate oxidase [Microbacterium sp. MPKO10]
MSHVIVVGSGIAGLTAALRADAEHDVTIVTKDALGDGNTARAQGGIAGVLFDDDAVDAHIADTIAAGAGLCNEDAVRILCSEGPERIRDLAAAGVDFDRDDTGYAKGLEAAHSYPRIVHAGGDATGRAIAQTLSQRVRDRRIPILDSTLLVDLVIEDGAVVGVDLLSPAGPTRLRADTVIIATGGCGQLYARTTNPLGATGDGVAAALRAGARITDAEFYQFHPTALAGSGFLISEAVRGAGAVLLDSEGRRFMLDVDPRAELAPRSVVALALARTMAAQGSRPVLLDATGVPNLTTRFPTITAAVRQSGFDWTREPVPVTPAAHYWMGGIATDAEGRTNVDGLVVVGEAAHTGVHGGNRLASNSLLEGAVFAERAAAALSQSDARQHPVFSSSASQAVETAATDTDYARGACTGTGCGTGAESAPGTGTDGIVGAGSDTRANTTTSRDAGEDAHSSAHIGSIRIPTVDRHDLQQLAWDSLGLERSAESLTAALDRLEAWESTPDQGPLTRTGIETGNLLLIAQVIARQALARTESRGAHARLDFPNTDPAQAHSTTVDALTQEALAC